MGSNPIIRPYKKNILIIKMQQLIISNNFLFRNLIDFTYKAQETLIPKFLCINLILPLIGILIASFIAGIPLILTTTSKNFKIQHTVAL